MPSDPDHAVMDLYGTRSPVYRNRDDAGIRTATLVLIDKTDTIWRVNHAADYRILAPISEVLNEIRKVQ